MKFRGILRSEMVVASVSRMAALYLRLALHTTRWEFDCSDADLRLITTEPVILAFWHERLLLTPAVLRLSRRPGNSAAGYPRINVLVSRHHDGRMIGRVAAHFGARAVHGSSAREKGGRTTERGGAAAIRRLASLLRSGEQIAVTPDGPRGPARSAKPGLAHLAAATGRPIVPCAVRSVPHLLLPTWDRMMLPLPFGRGVVALGPPVNVERGTTATIEAALDEVLRRTERPR